MKFLAVLCSTRNKNWNSKYVVSSLRNEVSVCPIRIIVAERLSLMLIDMGSGRHNFLLHCANLLDLHSLGVLGLFYLFDPIGNDGVVQTRYQAGQS
jgi:hypothetical protein